MGEIADMILEGALCECCGAYVEDCDDDIDDDGIIHTPGFPRRCNACKENTDADT